MTYTLKMRLIPVLLLSLCAGVLSSCGPACESSGLCQIAPAEPTPTAFASAPLQLSRGSTVDVTLQVNLNGLPASEPLKLTTVNPAATAAGPLVLAVFDEGRVRVSWDGVPKAAGALKITVSAAADARITPDTPQDLYITTSQIAVSRSAAQTIRGGSVTVGIAVR